MINEAFDEEVGEEPIGDHKRILAGRDVWLRNPVPGQFTAWKRYRENLIDKFTAIKVKAAKKPTPELVGQLQDIAEKLDLTTIELFESLVVREDDVDFLQMQMIAGKFTVKDMFAALFTDDEPEDDVEPPVVQKKPKPVKKAANAARTRR